MCRPDLCPSALLAEPDGIRRGEIHKNSGLDSKNLWRTLHSTMTAISRTHEAGARDTDSRGGDLIDRVRAGDRSAAAEFVLSCWPQIQWRVRRKMNAQMRRLFDSQEILSTVARRLDQFVVSRSLGTINRARLWGLVATIAQNAVVDKARILKRIARVEDLDREFNETLTRGVGGGGEASTNTDAESAEQVAMLLEQVQDPTDRSIFNMWLNEFSHVEIGDTLGLSPKAVEWRWRRVKSSLRDFVRSRPGFVEARTNGVAAERIDD